MATLKEYFYNVKCDCCGKLADEEMWQNEEGVIRGEIMSEENWKTLGGKDYCPDCWHYNDDDNIVTADGHVWNADTEELIDKQEMSKEQIAEIAKGIKVIKSFNDPVSGKVRYSVQADVDIFAESCIWNDPQQGLEAFVKEEVGLFIAYHSFGHPAMFKPSLSEVVKYIPEEMIGKFNAVRITYAGMSDDNTMHISNVTAYNVDIVQTKD